MFTTIITLLLFIIIEVFDLVPRGTLLNWHCIQWCLRVWAVTVIIGYIRDKVKSDRWRAEQWLSNNRVLRTWDHVWTSFCYGLFFLDFVIRDTFKATMKFLRNAGPPKWL